MLYLGSESFFHSPSVFPHKTCHIFYYDFLKIYFKTTELKLRHSIVLADTNIMLISHLTA